MTDSVDQFHTLSEAAEILGLSANTLRQQIKNGVLIARKIGWDWFITSAEIERYRTEHKRGGSDEPDIA